MPWEKNIGHSDDTHTHRVFRLTVKRRLYFMSLQNSLASLKLKKSPTVSARLFFFSLDVFPCSGRFFHCSWDSQICKGRWWCIWMMVPAVISRIVWRLFSSLPVWVAGDLCGGLYIQSLGRDSDRTARLSILLLSQPAFQLVPQKTQNSLCREKWPLLPKKRK